MNFKELLKESKLTQMQLADCLGKSQKLVSKWCVGECEPQISDLIKMQKILNVDTNVLLRSFKKNKAH